MNVRLKDGLYLFPNGKNFSQFIFYDEQVIEISNASYGELLIGFFDADLSKLLNMEKQIKKDNSAVLKLVNSLDSENYVYLFLKMLTDEVILLMTKRNIPFDKQYKMLCLTVTKYIEQIKNVHKTYWQYCDLYSIAPVPQKEKFNYLLNIDRTVGDLYVEKIISARRSGLDFFNNEKISEEYTTAYRFLSIENYIHFIFLKTLQYEKNFSKCEYCWRFFIPKTKKSTRFCNRVDLESGKTCKQIAPTKYRDEDIKNIPLFGEYDKAVQRNFKRMSRGENSNDNYSSRRNIDYLTYLEWHDKAQEALKLWREKGISDEEFKRIIHWLDY